MEGRTVCEARILVVDDDPVSMAVIQGLLEREGYDICKMDTGGEALDLVTLDPAFDLILLDVILPDTDGITLCRTLKSNPGTEHIPIVLISGFRTDDTSIRNGLEAGADGYLLKPIEDVALRAWVRATLHISALHKELAARVSAAAPGEEETLRKFAKLSHAVNNPLQTLYATVDILSLNLPQSDELNALTADIFKHAETVAKLVAEASLQAKALLESRALAGKG